MDYILNSVYFKEAQQIYEECHIPDDELQPMGAFDIETKDLVDGDYKNLRLAIDEFEKLKFNADEYEDSLCEIEELNGRIDKLEAWKESAKQQHLKDGTWVSQAREEELSDKIKSLESQLETERSMTEAGYVRGSSTGNCVWYRNLECLRKENEKLKEEIERRDQLEQDPTESEKQLLATQFNGFMGEMKELNKEIAQLKAENEKLKEENDKLKAERNQS